MREKGKENIKKNLGKNVEIFFTLDQAKVLLRPQKVLLEHTHTHTHKIFTKIKIPALPMILIRKQKQN